MIARPEQINKVHAIWEERVVSIVGKKSDGVGAASWTLALQMPLIARSFPEVAACHPATINLKLAQPLLVLSPDHRTEPIVWNPEKPAPETFEFLRVELEAPSGASPVSAWLYIAHNSLHRSSLDTHEVIAARLDLTDIDDCRITINRPTYQLPFSKYPLVVVA